MQVTYNTMNLGPRILQLSASVILHIKIYSIRFKQIKLIFKSPLPFQIETNYSPRFQISAKEEKIPLQVMQLILDCEYRSLFFFLFFYNIFIRLGF